MYIKYGRLLLHIILTKHKHLNCFKKNTRYYVLKYGLLLLSFRAYKHKKINLERFKNTRSYAYKNTVVCCYVLALIKHVE